MHLYWETFFLLEFALETLLEILKDIILTDSL